MWLQKQAEGEVACCQLLACGRKSLSAAAADIYKLHMFMASAAHDAEPHGTPLLLNGPALY